MTNSPYSKRSDGEAWKSHSPKAFHGLGFGIFLLLFCSGCSAVGVFATTDPYKKLAQAEQLQQTGRISVARRLIREAMETFEQQDDSIGLAESYRSYGFLLRKYEEGVVIDLDVSAPSIPGPDRVKRMDKSIEYFEKSLKLLKKNDQHEKIANLHYNIGVNHHFADRLDEACLAFDTSLEAHKRSMRLNPARSVVLPYGVESFAELIDQAKEEIGCRD